MVLDETKDFHHFGAGHGYNNPNNRTKNCVEIMTKQCHSQNDKWLESDCSANRSYVCQKSPDPVTTSTTTTTITTTTTTTIATANQLVENQESALMPILLSSILIVLALENTLK